MRIGYSICCCEAEIIFSVSRIGRETVQKAMASAIPSLHASSTPGSRPFARPFSGLRTKLRGFSFSETLDLSSKHSERLPGSLTSRTPRKDGCRTQVMMMPASFIRVYHEDRKFGFREWISLWNYFYRNRVVFLTQYLTDELVNHLASTLIYLDYVSTDQIWFYINCPGGDIIPCLTMYDAIHNTASIPGTLCLGFAYNLSGLILAAGEKGLRRAMPRAMIEFQPLGGEMHGLADAVSSEAKELQRLENYVHEQFSLKTGHPLEKIQQDFNRPRFFGALEAQDYGLIDHVLRGERIKENPPPRK